MTQLHQLTGQMLQLNQLAEDDPDMEIAVADTMEGIQAEFNDKAIALATLFTNLDATETALDNEIKRLQARKNRVKNRRGEMVNYLRENMEAAGIKKISCDLFTITWVIGREVVAVDDIDEIPDDYMVLPPVEAKPDKVKILAELKDGVEIPGVHKERNQASIRIK